MFVLGSYKTNCRTVDWPICAVVSVIAKMNNKLVM